MAGKAPITLAGNLPADDKYNGVAPIEEDLLADPRRIRHAVVAFDVMSWKHDVDTGRDVPTVRVRSIEPADGDDAEEVAKLLARLQERRLGTLPFHAADEDGDGPAPDPDTEPEPQPKRRRRGSEPAA
jgi:hypothetical protein